MKEQSRIYTHKCKNGTVATIVFSKPTDEEIHKDMCSLQSSNIQPDDWYFTKCDYVMNKKYTLEDWEDLQELSTEILKLNKELTKYNGISPVAFAK